MKEATLPLAIMLLVSDTLPLTITAGTIAIPEARVKFAVPMLLSIRNCFPIGSVGDERVRVVALAFLYLEKFSPVKESLAAETPCAVVQTGSALELECLWQNSHRSTPTSTTTTRIPMIHPLDIPGDLLVE